MKYAIESVKRFVNATVWDGYILEIATNTTDDDIRSRASSVYHPVGTASMSPVGADWGVVDPDLRIKHATGVRIVDASVLVGFIFGRYISGRLTLSLSPSCLQDILRRRCMPLQRGLRI